MLEAISMDDGRIFCLDAPGGTGNTFVLNTLLSAVRSDGFFALGTAISAVASKLLVNGSTGHLRLKVKIQIQENSFCYFTKRNSSGNLLLQGKLIIIRGIFHASSPPLLLDHLKTGILEYLKGKRSFFI